MEFNIDSYNQLFAEKDQLGNLNQG